MKLTEQQREQSRADRQKVDQLCRQERWKEAHDVFCTSPWANEAAKGSFADFKAHNQARIRKEDGGLTFAVKNALATVFLIVASFIAVGSAMKGMFVGTGSPNQIAFLIVTIASMGVAAVMYVYKKRLIDRL